MLTSDGYVSVCAPHHPNRNGHGRVLEHRLVMERMIGRLLESHEIVHHKDGVKTNNKPSNLELTTWSDHAKHHRPRLGTGKRATARPSHPHN
jgi:hypothetical protein